MRIQRGGKQSLRKSVFHTASAFSLFIALSLAPKPASASCALGVIPLDVLSSVETLMEDTAVSGLIVANAIDTLVTAVKGYAYNITMSVDAQNRARAAQSDARNQQETKEALAETRTELAKEFMPSLTTCREVSSQRRLGKAGVMYASYRTQLQKEGLSLSTGAPGSDAEKSSLQGFNKLWTTRCSKYADPDKMSPPNGVACPGPANAALRDLDVQPWKALLDPVQFSSPERAQAAKDSIRMLTEVSPPDHVRGVALTRPQGQNLHILRMRDVARMNLARGVLEDVAAMRVADPASGQSLSRLARYQELVTTHKFDPATGQMIVDKTKVPEAANAAEAENAALQTAAVRVATQQGLIFEIMRVAEQILSLEAVELAMKVEKNRSSAVGSAAGRVMQ